MLIKVLLLNWSRAWWNQCKTPLFECVLTPAGSGKASRWLLVSRLLKTQTLLACVFIFHTLLKNQFFTYCCETTLTVTLTLNYLSSILQMHRGLLSKQIHRALRLKLKSKSRLQLEVRKIEISIMPLFHKNGNDLWHSPMLCNDPMSTFSPLTHIYHALWFFYLGYFLKSWCVRPGGWWECSDIVSDLYICLFLQIASSTSAGAPWTLFCPQAGSLYGIVTLTPILILMQYFFKRLDLIFLCYWMNWS